MPIRTTHNDHGGTKAGWPAPAGQEAFQGLVGSVVRLIESHTESDPMALLAQFLVLFGNVIGRSAHFVAEADRHFSNEYVVLVGETAKGRKGSSLSQVRRLFEKVDPQWHDRRIRSGLSSGEGLIWQVLDQGTVNGKRDGGVRDKRLLVTEHEFASVLAVIQRHGNTLSPVIRTAWDSPPVLSSLTKLSSATATDPHVSLIGHITRAELLTCMESVQIANGFGNRFLWVCVKRSKVLPEGGSLDEAELDIWMDYVGDAVELASKVGRLDRDSEARELWREVYERLSEGKPGLVGAILSRAEAHVMRLASLYALSNLHDKITRDHLRAALAVWRYCEDSARYVFGDALGDPTADEILRSFRSKPDGLTRTEIRDLFGRNRSRDDIERALELLESNALAAKNIKGTKGRPVTRWEAMAKSRSY